MLRSLPYETVASIVGYLSLSDAYNLSTTCRHFRFLLQEDSICKAVLEMSANTLEARKARQDGRYARGLRRLVKRRDAISSASPFLAARVALAESWIYEHGVLCHICDRELRILDIHNSAAEEVVVDIKKLLKKAIPESRSYRKYKFRLLYYANNVVSCLYWHARPDEVSYWLLVFNPHEGRVLITIPLDSVHKIFVRNNDRCLYYGTHSEPGFDGFRRWIIRGFQFQKDGTGRSMEKPLHLPDLVGSDIGSTICFEIINGFFYGLSNQTSFEVEEIDWTSYYHCFRFPADETGFDHVEWSQKRDLWRRQHAEGTIDDRWTFLKIFQEEESEKILVTESRKEWLAGRCSATRTYYTRHLIFGPESANNNLEHSDQGESITRLLPINDHLTRCIGKKDHPNYMPSPRRDPKDVHVGDDGASSVMFTLSQCPIRSYHYSSQTFLDMVDDPHPSNPNRQRIRIRAGCRHLRRGSGRGECPLLPNNGYDNEFTFKQQTEDIYEQNTVTLWPQDHRGVCDASSPYGDLDEVLSTPGFIGNFEGKWDDRCVVYSTGGEVRGTLKAITVISFDPAIYFEGVRPFGADKKCSNTNDFHQMEDGDMAEENAATVQAIGSQPVLSSTTTATWPASRIAPSATFISDWAKKEPAMYRTLREGFHFAK